MSIKRKVFSARAIPNSVRIYFHVIVVVTVMCSVVTTLSVDVSAGELLRNDLPSPTAFRPPPITVTAPTQDQAPVGSFTVPIHFSNTTGDGIIGFQFNLDYNPAVIDPSSAGNFGCSTAGTISANLLATCNVTTQGTLRVVVYGSQPISGSGAALNITFVVDQPAITGSQSPLAFRNLLLENSSGAVASTPVNGSVTLVTGPTSANVFVGGSVVDSFGRGIANARITMIDQLGNRRFAQSSQFGYFRVNEVPSGETYIISVRAPRAAFSQPAQVIFVNQSIGNILFRADEPSTTRKVHLTNKAGILHKFPGN
ncbi:MAG: hypothetical protein KIS76_08735 [Pyrinomonadaceae bacterium]|nr:hypothetical protein [Pyrinomonadaceae bacterium]